LQFSPKSRITSALLPLMNRSTATRLLADYGMVFVLLLLCVLFSVLTLSEQPSTGEAAARQLAGEVSKGARVMIAMRDQAEDKAFARELETAFKAKGAEVVVVVTGEPKDARIALTKITGKLDAIACNQATAAWLVFSDLPHDFPSLGAPKIIQARPHRWPDFLKLDNLLNITNQIAVIAIIAVGMTMVVIAGGIDLSVGSLIALSAVLCAMFIRDFAGALNAGAFGMTLACLVAIAVCGGAGAFSGFMITKFRLPPFIVTLSMMLMARGIPRLFTHEQSVYQLPDSFVWLGRGANLFGIPNAVVLMALLYILAHILMTRLPLGRYIYAVGGNLEAARLSGIRVARVQIFTYVVSGALAGLGGIVMASQLKSGAPSYGQMYELYVIAAVVVGGASLSGGSGRMFNTLIGAFIIAVIQNGMNLTKVESAAQLIVLGFVILGAVLLDTWRAGRYAQ
jgi:ribose transport system permease protein